MKERSIANSINTTTNEKLQLLARNVGNAIGYEIIHEQQCRNKYNHVSAWPGYGRIICPVCQKVYVRK